MPILLRLLIGGLIAYIAGAVITPLLWGPVLMKQSTEILSPFTMVSAGVLIGSIGYAVAQFRRRP